MSVKDSESRLMSRVFSQEKKIKMMKDILGNLLKQGNPLLYERENDILRWILIEDKSVKEVAEKICLTPTTTKHIFNRSFKRMCLNCSEVTSTLHNTKAMEKNIHFLTNKLNEYEIKEGNYSLLSSDTKEILKMKVDDADFTIRLKNSLRYANIITVADLVKMCKRDLQGYRNVGKHTINEIEDFFKLHKLSWDMKLMDNSKFAATQA